MKTDAETIALYDRRAEDYAQFAGNPAESRILQAFIDAIPFGGRVLDLGCGPGLSSARMVAAGLDVVATDASAEMTRLARANSAAEVRQEAFSELLDQAVYDGVWASFSLLHAPRSDFPHHLAAIHRAMRRGGRFHLGMKLGEGQKRDALGRLYTYYSEAELEELLTAAQFNIVGRHTWQGKGLAGGTEPFIAVFAHA